ISSYYSKGMFSMGDHIRLGEVEGRIIEITNLSVVVETDEGHRYIPARKFINEEVEVLARAADE
ncbi:MAG: mechanosensitive ion channel domain-containing protein, partial [Bacteroidota bacterium]